MNVSYVLFAVDTTFAALMLSRFSLQRERWGISADGHGMDLGLKVIGEAQYTASFAWFDDADGLELTDMESAKYLGMIVTTDEHGDEPTRVALQNALAARMQMLQDGKDQRTAAESDCQA